MKKINDSKLYLIFSTVTLVLGILLGISAFYSIYSIKPEVVKFLSVNDNISQNYKKAYVILRSPHLFAGYENLDSEQDLQVSLSRSLKMKIDTNEDLEKMFSNTFSGRTAVQAIKYFDKKITSGEEIVKDEKKYIEVLLHRRIQGANLARNSMIFVLSLSFIGWLLFFYEKRVAASYKEE